MSTDATHDVQRMERQKLISCCWNPILEEEPARIWNTMPEYESWGQPESEHKKQGKSAYTECKTRSFLLAPGILSQGTYRRGPVVESQRSKRKRCNIEEETLVPSMKTARHYTKEGARHGANNLQLSYIEWSKLFENRTIKEATLKTRTAEPTASKHRRRSMPPQGIFLRSR